ncbi:MAG TPA: guanylate kinase [Inquilinus sp.]
MTTEIARRGLMLVLSSPSGAGKTSITRAVLAQDPNLTISVSVTTRAQRPGEIDGTHYHFIDQATYDAMVANDELLERAKVFGNGYGTPRAPVEAALAAGRDVIFDIDWQGTQQLAQKVRTDLVSVFVLPPTVEALEQRLRARAQDSDEVIASRMAKAADEMSHWPEYDYAVINRDLDASIAQVQAILAAERLRRSRQTGLPDFVRSLQAKL